MDHNLDMDEDRQQHLESDICRSIDGEDANSYSFSESLGSPLQASSDCPIRRRDSHDSTPGQNLQKFVSHRTHTNEDLGVDHIFVKPEEPMSLQEAQSTINSMGITDPPTRSRPSFEESKQNEEVYAELESDMDGIDTMRKFTEEVIADTRAYRSEEEEKKRNRILLLARSEEHEEEKAQDRDREFSAIHSSSVPVESADRGPSQDILMSTAALTTQLQLQLTASTFLFFANSRVIPTSIPLDVWSTAFLLSDHRPVSSSIILAKLSGVKN